MINPDSMPDGSADPGGAAQASQDWNEQDGPPEHDPACACDHCPLRRN